LRRCAGDFDLAADKLLESAPDIEVEPERWFGYFDFDKSGSLDFGELELGFRKTLKAHGIDKEYASAAMRELWEAFVLDRGEQQIFKEDLLTEGGLRQALLARLGLLPDESAEDPDEAAPDASPAPPASEEFDDSEEGHMDYVVQELEKLQPGGVLGVLFAARMDCPAVDITAQLKEAYVNYSARKIDFRVLFVSADRSANDFEAHRDTMPSDWAVVDYCKRGCRWKLMQCFNVTSLPTMCVVGKDGVRVTSEGCQRILADPSGAAFPWDSPGIEVQEKDEARQFWSHLRKSMSSDVDDEEMGRTAGKLPLTQESYELVASFKSNHAMRTFFWRVLELKAWDVLDETKFGQLVWEHSGIRRTQSLQALLKDFTDADWIDKHTVVAKIETPSAEGADLGDGGAVPMITVSGADRRAALCPGGASTDSVPVITVTGADRRSVLHPGGEGPSKSGPSDATAPAEGKGSKLMDLPLGSKAGEAGEMPTATMTSRLAHMTMMKGKGKGRALYKPTVPPAASETAAIDEKKAEPPAKGKAPAPKGAGKAAGKPAGPKGAPPAKGGGKGKGGATPTRPERENWTKKRKNKLHWKRYILPSPYLQKSLFNTADVAVDAEVVEVDINEEMLATVFQLSGVAARESKEGDGDGDVIKLPLWASTEKKSPAQRRQDMAITALKWQRANEGDDRLRSDLLISRLTSMDFEAILNDSCFINERDDIEMLVEKLDTIQPEERERLKAGAVDPFEWEENVEGFYRKLITVDHVEAGLKSFRGHLEIADACSQYTSKLQSIKDSVQLVLDCTSLRTMLQKLLTIGNCLNAGDKNLGCADGFDAITLVQKTILINMPKGNDNVSVLQYMNEHEVPSEAWEQLEKLAEGLSKWKLQASDDAPDEADIEEIQNLVGKQSRQLVSLMSISKGMPYFEAKIKEHETSISDLDMFLDEMRCTLKVLQAWVVHDVEAADDKKTSLPTGKVLATLGAFAAQLTKVNVSARRGSARRHGGGARPRLRGSRVSMKAE